MFMSFAMEAALLARFDGGLTWPEIRDLFAGAPRSEMRDFIVQSEESGHLRWTAPPRVRGVARGRGRWTLTDAGRLFVRACAEGTA